MMEDLLNEDLVDAPDEIERVVEGGEEGGRRNISGQESGSDNGAKENENKENENDQDKEKIKIKRKIGPRPIVNADRLKGPRGLAVMESFFSDVKLRGKGHEREDLDLVMGRLEHWTHRLCPKMQFDDSLKRIEKLGSRKDVSNLVKRIRLGMVDEEGIEAPVVDFPDSPPPGARAHSPDPFDQLLSSHSVPAAPATVSSDITDEQRERMLRNRLIAEERRAARIQKAKEMQERFKNNTSSQSQAANEGENQRTENADQESMDVDENIGNGQFVGENAAVLGNENEVGDNRNNIVGEIGNQPDLIGNDNADVPLENGMDVDEMQPDILSSGNHVQPDLLRAASQIANNERENDIDFGARGNQPDVLGAAADGSNGDTMERNQNQPDILSISDNPPDILAGRSENPPDLVGRNTNPPDLLN